MLKTLVDWAESQWDGRRIGKISCDYLMNCKEPLGTEVYQQHGNTSGLTNMVRKILHYLDFGSY